MEKSIETIWKEGFVKNDALIAPKLNDLYNQKSIDIVAKFKRMYRINRIAIVVFAILIIPISYITKMVYMGIPMAVLFAFASLIAHKFSKQLDGIDKNTSSYDYLNTFNEWVNDMIAVNSKLSTFMYPYIFTAVILGFWHIEIDDIILGHRFITGYLNAFPDSYLISGLPIVLIIFYLLTLSLLAFFGGKIGKWDINLVYGGILNRLKELLSDMEELRK